MSERRLPADSGGFGRFYQYFYAERVEAREGGQGHYKPPQGGAGVRETSVVASGRELHDNTRRRVCACRHVFPPRAVVCCYRHWLACAPPDDFGVGLDTSVFVVFCRHAGAPYMRGAVRRHGGFGNSYVHVLTIRRG